VSDYVIPDYFWMTIEPLLLVPKPKKKSGRPRRDDRLILSDIFYLLLTGCQWKLLPRVYGAPSTVHDRFQEWRREGFFERPWTTGLLEYNIVRGLEWE
jgi:putative transposase